MSNAFKWQGEPSIFAGGKQPATRRTTERTPQENTRIVLRQHSIGGLTQDEIEARVSAQRAVIAGNRLMAAEAA